MAGLVTAAGLIRLAFVPFDRVLTEDAFGYLIKALEITRGDLTPMATHAIGWPLALAPFVALAPGSGITAAMTIARVVSVLAAALVMIPLWSLCARLVDRRTGRLALALVGVSTFLIGTAVSAMAEPLFTLLLIGAVAAVVRAREHPAAAAWAGALAGLSFWVRPHGAIAVAAVWLALLVSRHADGTRTHSWRRLLGAALVTLVAAFPAAVQRQIAFGSPVDFGENVKILVDQPEQILSPNVAAPSPSEYLSTHSAGEIVDRIAVQGVWRVLRQTAVYIVTLPLLPFFLAGLARRWRDPAFRPVLVVTGVWLAALIPHAHGGERHLFPVIPLVMLLVADGFERLARRFNAYRFFRAVFVAGVVVVSLSAAAWYRHRALNDGTRDALVWGRWAAANVRGTLAIVEGSAAVMMFLPDTSAAGVGLMDLYAPRTGLRVIRPGVFPSLDEAMAWMRGVGVTHLAVDDHNIGRRPYLEDVRDPATRPACFRQIYADDAGASAWAMRIFEIDWPSCAGGRKGDRGR